MRVVGVEKLHATGAEDFEAVVKIGSGLKGLSAEAGAGVINFKNFDGLGGSVADCCGDVGRLATGGKDGCEEKCEGGKAAHESQGYQPQSIHND